MPLLKAAHAQLSSWWCFPSQQAGGHAACALRQTLHTVLGPVPACTQPLTVPRMGALPEQGSARAAQGLRGAAARAGCLYRSQADKDANKPMPNGFYDVRTFTPGASAMVVRASEYNQNSITSRPNTARDCCLQLPSDPTPIPGSCVPDPNCSPRCAPPPLLPQAINSDPCERSSRHCTAAQTVPCIPGHACML